MSLVTFQITERKPYADGASFGAVGVYEHIEAIAHYEVDPTDPANASIVDLEFAPRNADGKVAFWGDVTLLRPLDASRANRALLLEAPNRGYRIALRALNRAPQVIAATARMDPGDGFLFRHGWTIAFCGWQWDVPRGNGRLGLVAPRVTDPSHRAGDMLLRIQPNQDEPFLALTDQHVGAIGHHLPIPPAENQSPTDRLYVRNSPYGEAELIARDRWRFDTQPDLSATTEKPNAVVLDGGFEAGRVYDLVYVPDESPVVGCGMLALRDCATFLKHDEGSPTHGSIDHVVGEGQSQCGRLLRTYLHLGLNQDESGRRAFDGLLVHIAGGRRGEFNHRFGQPSVQPTPSFGHQWPFSDTSQVCPQTARRDGLLDRTLALHAPPKIMYTDTSSEYWRGDAALTHVRLADLTDLELPSNVRRYLFSSTQHGPGEASLSARSHFGSHGANTFNAIDYRPLYRAALTRLYEWVSDDDAPPPSRYPRRDDGTAVHRHELLERLSMQSILTLPSEPSLTALYPLSLGANEANGVGEYPANVIGDAYPGLVSDIDDDGNEIAGVPMPDVTVALGSHTGFNPRHPDSGGAGQLLEYLGSTVPFALNESARDQGHDPRPSIAARYHERETYLRQVAAAAQALAQDRYLLDEDIDTCVAIAAARWDAWVG